MAEISTNDLKLLLPLIGVLIGWILTNLSGLFKGISEENKIFSRCLVQLHFLFLEQRKILNLFEWLKDTHGVNQEYETVRAKFVKRYALSDENFKALSENIQEMSGVNPFLGIKLKSLIENHLFSQKINFEQSSKLENDIYLNLL